MNKSFTIINGKEVWKYKATYGIPLDIILMKLSKANILPTWVELFEAAYKDGTNLEKLSRELIFIIKEEYSEDVYNNCKDKLPLMPKYIYEKSL